MKRFLAIFGASRLATEMTKHLFLYVYRTGQANCQI